VYAEQRLKAARAAASSSQVGSVSENTAAELSAREVSQALREAIFVPALIYIAINWGNSETLKGWAIPAATDIAFALGVLSLLGKRVPTSLKVLLAALAIIDDLGAAIGLLVGKQIGIFLLAALAIRMGLAKLPEGSSWTQLYGVALLCGIGFTMSLFIGNLAFAGSAHLIDEVKVGVLIGSILAAIAGVLVLRRSSTEGEVASM
jgi:Na+/H+ antiporter NhaA